MSDVIEQDLDNVRYSFDTQEFFQRQVEVAVNEYINKFNTENDKVFTWFIGDQYGRNKRLQHNSN